MRSRAEPLPLANRAPPPQQTNPNLTGTPQPPPVIPLCNGCFWKGEIYFSLFMLHLPSLKTTSACLCKPFNSALRTPIIYPNNKGYVKKTLPRQSFGRKQHQVHLYTLYITVASGFGESFPRVCKGKQLNVTEQQTDQTAYGFICGFGIQCPMH